MKKLLYISVCAVMLFSVAGCKSNGNSNNADNNTNNEIQQDTEQNNDAAYAETVAEYFPTDSKYRLYNGYAEAGFEIKYSGKSENKETGSVTYSYDGAMCDGMGSEGERVFKAVYIVEDNSVIESVENSDTNASSSRNVYSIIPDFIVLKGDIQVDNSWEQRVDIDGNGYIGTTTIINVTDDSFTTRTEIPMAGYKNNTYTEERTYKKGVGITAFNNTPYGSDEDDTLIFGYGFSTENDRSVTGEI